MFWNLNLLLKKYILLPLIKYFLNYYYSMRVLHVYRMYVYMYC